MDLQDLKTQTEEEADYEPEEETIENDLSNAISLLEDCGKLLEFLSIEPRIPEKLQDEIDETADAIYDFLDQFTVPEEADSYESEANNII